MLTISILGLIGLIVFILYNFASRFRRKESRGSSQIPGAEDTGTEDGNLAEIKESGGLCNFMTALHRTKGPIVSYWMGKIRYVSIASPELFEEHSMVFDRPYDLFKIFVVNLTGPDSIQIANGHDGRRRHAVYSKSLNLTSVNKTFGILHKLSLKMVTSWLNRPSDALIMLQKDTFKFAISAILESSFGSKFEDEQLVKELHESYNVCWKEVEELSLGSLPKAGSEREQLFQYHKSRLEQAICDVIEQRKENPPVDGEHLLIDAAIGMRVNDSVVLADMITFFIGGFHTTATLLVWAIYYLAKDQVVQDRLRLEIKKYCDEIGGVTQLSSEALNELVYLQQVLNETLRCSILAPLAARCSDEDTLLGGYVIPAGTPVIQSIGVLLHDPDIYPNPTKFDPDRFSLENINKRKPFSFEPFGFAGKRKCPGYKLSMAEATILLSHLLTSFKITLVPGLVVEPLHGFVTRPKDAIWISIEPVLAYKQEM